MQCNFIQDENSWEYISEPSDRLDILEQLLLIRDEFDVVIEAIPETFEYTFINPITENHIMMILDTETYIDQLEVFKLIDINNYKLFAQTMVKYERNLALSLSLALIEYLSRQPQP
jgi:hypothetical protein